MSRVDYKELQESLYLDFESKLKAERFWHVIPEGECDTVKAVFLFDSTTGLLYTPTYKLNHLVSNYSFLNVLSAENDKLLARLQADTRLLWALDLSSSAMDVDNANNILEKYKGLDLSGWKLPDTEQLLSFSKKSGNPYRLGRSYRLNVGGHERYTILTVNGYVDVDSGCSREPKEPCVST